MKTEILVEENLLKYFFPDQLLANIIVRLISGIPLITSQAVGVTTCWKVNTKINFGYDRLSFLYRSIN